MQPGEVDAFEIAEALLEEGVSSVERFQTGLHHFVYEVALTRMALLSMRSPTDYVDAWCEAMEPGTAPADRLDLYTALHCVAFLGEIGQSFNREEPKATDAAYREHLEQTLASLL